jgi:hypothetical protein
MAFRGKKKSEVKGVIGGRKCEYESERRESPRSGESYSTIAQQLFTYLLRSVCSSNMSQSCHGNHFSSNSSGLFEMYIS